MESAAILGLTNAETGRLFGITRQAVGNWYKKGVPMNRIADVERVAEMARALHERFIAERIPKIVREPLPGLKERSILEEVQVSGSKTVLDLLDRVFSYVPNDNH